MQFIDIGFGNFLSVQRIVCVLSPESAPIKRIIQTAKADNLLVDATFGRKTQSVIITDCEQVFISSINTEDILGKINYINEGSV